MTPRSLRVVLKTKPGYEQQGYSRGVLFILLAFDTVIRQRLRGVPRTLTLTAGTNDHSAGAHFRCEAEDARSKTGFRGPLFKRDFLSAVMAELEPIVRWTDDAGEDFQVFTAHYWGTLENEGEEDEHFHVQVRRGHLIGL